ncbi:NAD(P)/FAD-dependent oxidoreductase [Oleomonas cavernae]|uniref:NAD(P)/FAD-dependent oxidoreductase n=1 Tax=Oleomonas cavernae TaxID=2320859 RepID=A0A418WGX7_9PROT|nr:NAD(P)/FAD-dependent oxidoreductase [Oleomonas cavernae]RJF89291.1 NAD(P)/FAD-dependent oxidoreductase [Oleomonas cavernae]
MSREHFDVLIVGAGLSGVGAAYRLQTECPGKSYKILEGRPSLGGTWDLFRYPGIRSDSDMYTLGYPFRPWKEAKAIADGPSILKYIRDTAEECGIDRHIRFSQRVKSAAWSTEESLWLVEVEGPEGKLSYTCSFLYLCSGYYSYAGGNMPAYAGAETFKGSLIHPQEWPKDLDYTGKNVVVIGSGATAVTLIPAMAPRAKHVTMLQRSPTYVTSMPSQDRMADRLRNALPEKFAHNLLRWRNVLFGIAFYQLARRAPNFAKRGIMRQVMANLPKDFDVKTHFEPSYSPWSQRVCLVPDGDLFEAIKQGQASVVTDHIDTFVEDGIRLTSGKIIQADIVVSATGLKLIPCGGIQLKVDGTAIDLGKTFVYKGLMLSGIPNMAMCLGYTNASWTLRADLASLFVCRLLKHMGRNGYQKCVAECDDNTVEPRPLLDLKSGYVTRATAYMPKQGSKAPWYLRQNFILDLITMRYQGIRDKAIRFSRKPVKVERSVGAQNARAA